MTKSLTDIAKEQGACLFEKSGVISFINEAQLKATVDAYNAQVSEPVAWVCLIDDEELFYTDEAKAYGNGKNAEVTPLYTSPQTIPPAVAEYIERLENSMYILLTFNSKTRWIGGIENGRYESSGDALIKAIEQCEKALASKPKELK